MGTICFLFYFFYCGQLNYNVFYGLKCCKDISNRYAKKWRFILDDGDRVDLQPRYNQWVSADRCELLEVTKDWEDFIHDFSVSVVKLSNHHYVAIRQSRTFKECKDNAVESEAAVVGASARTIRSSYRTRCKVITGTLHNAPFTRSWLTGWKRRTTSSEPSLTKIRYFSHFV